MLGTAEQYGPAASTFIQDVELSYRHTAVSSIG